MRTSQNGMTLLFWNLSKSFPIEVGIESSLYLQSHTWVVLLGGRYFSNHFTPIIPFNNSNPIKVMLVKFYSLQVRKLRHREGKASHNIPDISPASPYSVMQQSGCSGNPPSWFSTSGPLQSQAPLFSILSSLIFTHLPLPTSSFHAQLKCYLSREASPEPFSCFRSYHPHNHVISLQIIICLSTRMYNQETRACPQLVQYLAITGVQKVTIE